MKNDSRRTWDIIDTLTIDKEDYQICESKGEYIFIEMEGFLIGNYDHYPSSKEIEEEEEDIDKL